MPTVIYRLNQRAQGSTFRIIKEDLVPEVTAELRTKEYKGDIDDPPFAEWKFSGDRIFLIGNVSSSVSDVMLDALHISLMYIKKCVLRAMPFDKPETILEKLHILLPTWFDFDIIAGLVRKFDDDVSTPCTCILDTYAPLAESSPSALLNSHINTHCKKIKSIGKRRLKGDDTVEEGELRSAFKELIIKEEKIVKSNNVSPLPLYRGKERSKEDYDGVHDYRLA